MKNKLVVHDNKTLRLENVLIRDISDDLFQKDISIDFIAAQMENMMANKGVNPVGPLIQYMDASAEGREPQTVIMLQCDIFIDRLEKCYEMVDVLRIKNCMYLRFQGLEEDLPIAYQKIKVEAYERDIELKGSSYTVFVNMDDIDDIIVDIFMEKA